MEKCSVSLSTGCLFPIQLVCCSTIEIMIVSKLTQLILVRMKEAEVVETQILISKEDYM